MNLHYFTIFLNSILMLGLPIALTVYLTRRYKLRWRLFWVGAATFIISQIGHIPFNLIFSEIFNNYFFLVLHPTIQLLIQALFMGLSAATFEELSRYGMYRWWQKGARSWEKALLIGAGHGGIESIILGLLALWAAIQIVIIRLDLFSLLQTPQLITAQNKIEEVFSMPVLFTLLGAFERISAIIIHLACSVIVLQTFVRKQLRWIGLAILLHFTVDGVTVFIQGIGLSPLVIEATLFIFALGCLGIIKKFRDAEVQVENEKA